jgi:hypothetical protein
MANFKISQLPAAGAVSTEDIVPMVKTSIVETEKATLGQVIDLAAETITSIPNLIVDPATNFTDFTGSVRDQFTAGTNISISDGVISSTAASNITSITGSENIDIADEAGPIPAISLKDTITGLTSVSSSGFTGSFTGSFAGDGSQLTNLTASQLSNFTTDVRAQFTAGSNVSIVNGVISSVGSGSGGGDITSVVAGTNLSGGGTVGDVTLNLNDTLTGLTSVSASSLSGALKGDGSQITNLTASQMAGFQNDVRSQFSAGTGIVINGGEISASNVPNSSLQNSSITLNGTSVSLGGTKNDLGVVRVIQAGNNIGVTGGSSATASVSLSSSLIGLTSITSSQLSASNVSLTGSFKGNGSQLTNLTASQFTGFANDVRNQISAGSGVSIVGGKISSLITGGSNFSITNGADGAANIINLSPSIQVTAITASFFTGSSITASVGKFDLNLSSSAVSASNFTGSKATFQDLTTKGLTVIGDAAADSITFNASAANVTTFLNFASNLLYIDNTNNKVAVNQASAGANGSTFTVKGSFAANVQTYTTSKTASVDDCFINVIPAGAGIVIALPTITAELEGRIYTITSVNKTTFSVTGSMNYKGADTGSLSFDTNTAGKFTSVQVCAQTLGAQTRWVVISSLLT